MSTTATNTHVPHVAEPISAQAELSPTRHNEASAVSTQPESTPSMSTKSEAEGQNKAMRLRGGCIPCPVRISNFAAANVNVTLPSVL